MYQSKEIPRIFDRDVKIPSESFEVGTSGMSGISGRICGSAGGSQDEVILFFLVSYYTCRDSRSQHAAGRSPIQSLACTKASHRRRYHSLNLPHFDNVHLASSWPPPHVPMFDVSLFVSFSDILSWWLVHVSG